MLYKNFIRVSLLLLVFIGLSSFILRQQKQEPAPQAIDGEKKFAKFLKLFPEAPLPYQQDIQLLHDLFEWEENPYDLFHDKQSPFAAAGEEIKSEFKGVVPGMIRSGFSRMGPDRNYAEQIIAKEDNMIALLYSTIPPYGASKIYSIATFDQKGNFIENKEVGLLSLFNERQCVFTIDSDLNISCQHYKNEGEPKKHKLKAQYSETFQINRFTGKILAQQKTQETTTQEEIWNY